MLMLALGVWTSTRSPSVAVPILRVPAASAGGRGLAASRNGLPVGAAPSPTTAAQLHSMDPAALDRQVAEEEAGARQAQGRTAPAKGSWLVGEAGTYLVGRGVFAGTYASAGASQGKVCRWGVSGSDGTTDRSGSGKGRVVVTIRTVDGFFETSNCSNWHKIS